MNIWETTTETALEQLFLRIREHYADQWAGIANQTNNAAAIAALRKAFAADLASAVDRFQMPEAPDHYMRQIKLKFITKGLGYVSAYAGAVPTNLDA